MERPYPPRDRQKDFIASEELGLWVRSTFLDDNSPLYNGDHDHLKDAVIGFLWAFPENSRAGRQIIGEAEIFNPKGGKWQKARQYQQIDEFFAYLKDGEEDELELDFIITLDAPFSLKADGASFCALVEHELYHCSYKLDESKMPWYNDEGKLKYVLKGHDVEEFTGVVRRYGTAAVSPEVSAFVAAASMEPEIAPAQIASGCGNCLRLA